MKKKGKRKKTKKILKFQPKVKTNQITIAKNEKINSNYSDIQIKIEKFYKSTPERENASNLFFRFESEK